jgi:hypothetical protein
MLPSFAIEPFAPPMASFYSMERSEVEKRSSNTRLISNVGLPLVADPA